MRKFGKLWLDNNKWKIQAEPRVLIRLKNIFPKINKFTYEIICISNTPENCRELEWFLLRYPLEVNNEDVLRKQSNECIKTLAELEQITLPDYIPKENYKMSHPPRHYQIISDQIYNKRKFLLNADQMGLGKTVTAICSFTDSNKLPALVVCQAHLQKQWKEEINLFLPSATVHIVKKNFNYNLPDVDVYIISYSKLSSWVEILTKFIRSVVYDEIQELRRCESGKHSAAKHLNRKVTFRLGLSGSPIYNYGDEMFNIMNCLEEGSLGDKGEFVREWCEYRWNGSKISDPKAFGTYLRENFLMLRRTEDDVGFELPKEQKVIQYIPYDEAVLSKINTDAVELAKLVLEGKFTEQGQAAREFDMKLRQQTGIAKAPHVANFSKLILETGQKIILCAWHREVWDIYLELLSDYKPVLYTGSETSSKKDSNKNLFVSGDSQVFLLSLRSGTGLNGLQNVCHNILFGELDWSPEIHKQCIRRLRRPGQNKSVMVFYLLADGGSDPTIAELNGVKKIQSEGILDPDSELFEIRESSESRVKELAKAYLKKQHHTKT